MAISLDEFFEMAKLGGQIKACHDIFDIINNKDYDEKETTRQLMLYQQNSVSEFKKASLKFKMNGGMVAVDEESVESLEEPEYEV